MKTDEDMKQKKFKIKPDRNKRRRPQKCKANDSDGKDWKHELRKAIKTD